MRFSLCLSSLHFKYLVDNKNIFSVDNKLTINEILSVGSGHGMYEILQFFT